MLKMTKQILHECFNYDQETGWLVWRPRPSYHFLNESIRLAFITRCAGKFAGRREGRVESRKQRTVLVGIKGKRQRFYIASLVWMYHHGRHHHHGRIGFKDGNFDNTRIENLYLMTPLEAKARERELKRKTKGRPPRTPVSAPKPEGWDIWQGPWLEGVDK